MKTTNLKLKRELSHQLALGKYQVAEKAVKAAELACHAIGGWTTPAGQEAYRAVQAARAEARKRWGVYSRLHRAWLKTPA